MSILGFPEGVDWHQPYQIRDSQNIPLNLTGADFQMLIFDPETFTNVLILTIGAGITVTSAVNGLIRLDVVAADSIDLAGDYQFEIAGTLGNGDAAVLGGGELHISPSRIGAG